MELDQESLSLFAEDLEEDIERIDKGLLEIEKTGQEIGVINEIMRAAHNIKGSSAMVGFDRMKKITHAVENVMIDIKNGKTMITPELVTLLLKCMDRVKLLRDKFVLGDTNVEIDDLVEKLKDNQMARDLQVSQREEAVQKQPVPTQAQIAVQAVQKADSIQTVKVNLNSIENIMNHISEIVMIQSHVFSLNKNLKRQYNKDSKFIESFGMLEHMDKEIKRLFDEFIQLSMTPIETVFRNFPRMIRDLEIALGKSINLVIENVNSRLDKNIAEEIVRPLIHILRNSADHGIEMPQERLIAGKPERGVIRISTLQKGEQIIITIEDDGKGIDDQKVLATAIKKGIVNEEQAKLLTKREIYNLIFSPSFSTAEKITDISGRGVGMDVVLNSIKKVNGTIDVESEKGRGTKITLKIPSTLSVIPCIVFEINKRILCIPAINVDVVLSMQSELIAKREQGETIDVNDMDIAVVKLYDKFGASAKKNNRKTYAVVCGLAEKRVALVVDRLLGSQKVIIKPMSKIVGKVRNIAGTAILEDGRVALVMDVADIVKSSFVI
ncbi:MAG: chemotaxis protein CheA [Ignavibacteriales bacterium]